MKTRRGSKDRGGSRVLSPTEQDLARQFREALVEKLVQRGCHEEILAVLVDRVEQAKNLDQLARKDRPQLRNFIKRIRRLADEAERRAELSLGSLSFQLSVWADVIEEELNFWYSTKRIGSGPRPARRGTEEEFLLLSYVKAKTGRCYFDDVGDLLGAVSGDALRERYRAYLRARTEDGRAGSKRIDQLRLLFRKWDALRAQMRQHPDFFSDPMALSKRKSS